MDAPAVESPATVQSLAELRERHLALLRAWTPSPTDGLPAHSSAEAAPAGVSPRVREAEALREAAAALGAWLDDPEERDRAQGMIDYWTAALGALPDYAFPQMLQLARFDPALPAAAVERAEALLAEHEGTARAAEADAILLRLVRPGPGDTIVCQPPLDRAFLEHADGVTDATAAQDSLIESLVAVGVIRKIPGESAEQDKFDFMHGSIARACPRLKDLLDKRRNANATRDKLRATALLWKDSGQDRGVLLTGPALDDAVRYLGEDKVLDEFIRASRDAEERGKRFRLMLWTSLTTAVVVALLLIGGLAYFLGKDTGFIAGNSIGFSEGESRGAVVGAAIESEAPDALANLRDPDVDRVAAEAQPPRPPGAPGIDGWIWVGDDQLRLLRWLDSRRPVDPGRISRGVAYRTRTAIRLRGAGPGERAGPGADFGVMPAGALLIARGRPRRIDRPTGAQYWLAVTLVPRVRLQFTRRESQDLADRFAARLRQSGLDVDAPGLIVGENIRPLLNYFRKDDAGAAAYAAGAVAGALQRPDGTPPLFTCALVANSSVGPGILELTLDFDGLALREDGAAAPPPECR